MNFEKATKKQLLQIAFDDSCPLEFRYEAARELQLKRWDNTFILKLVKYWGEGMEEWKIARLFGVEEWEVHKQLLKYGLFGKRVKERKVDYESEKAI
jgi:hypothetical protein